MIFSKATDRWGQWALLACLLANYLLVPFLGLGSLSTFLCLLLTSLVSCFVVSGSHKELLVSFLICVPLLTPGLSFSLDAQIEFSFIFVVLGVGLFYSYIAFYELRLLFRAREVDLDVLISAICVYLLTSIVFASAYGVLHTLDSHSFNFLQGINHFEAFHRLVYFSTVTFTTLGYGDFVPLSSKARAISGLQAVFGQIYLTIVVARLVSIHASEKNRK